jgi:hypothetical protein
MSEVHQFVLDCGATFTNELYKLTQLSFSPFGNERAEIRTAAEANIRDNCVRPEAPAAKPADTTPPAATSSTTKSPASDAAPKPKQ